MQWAEPWWFSIFCRRVALRFRTHKTFTLRDMTLFKDVLICFRYHIINWPFVHGFSGYFLWSAESKDWRLCGRWTRSDADWNRSCRWLGQNWRDHTTHKSGSVPTRMFPLFLGYYFSCFTTFINIILYIYIIYIYTIYIYTIFLHIFLHK